MRWPKDPVDQPRPTFPYRVIRKITREFVESWFRELPIVDADHLPEVGGTLLVAWHPGGTVDPVIIGAAIPTQLTFVASSHLWKVPVLGQVLRLTRSRPIHRAIDTRREGFNEGSRRTRNNELIGTLGDVLSEGGRAVVFPEGHSHLMSRPTRIRSGAARIMLDGIRKADSAGRPRPHMVPLGLHYEKQGQFRDRAMLQVFNPMRLPPLPGEEGAPEPDEEILEQFSDNPEDRAWIMEVTRLLSGEMLKTSQGLDSWADRALMWRGRSMVRAHRHVEGRVPTMRATFEEAVLEARRVRAAWIFLDHEEPAVAAGLRTDVETHQQQLDSKALADHDLYRVRERWNPLVPLARGTAWTTALLLTACTLIPAFISAWLPYRLAGYYAKRSDDERAAISARIMNGIALFPPWWALLSLVAGWLVAAQASPLEIANPRPFWVTLEALPWPVVAALSFPLWLLIVRFHYWLIARRKEQMRQLRRWVALSTGRLPWAELVRTQQRLAGELVDLGNALVLPGDADWTDPATGEDDRVAVSVRDREAYEALLAARRLQVLALQVSSSGVPVAA